MTQRVGEKKTIRVKSNPDGYELPSLDLLKEAGLSGPPETLDDFVAYAKKLTKRDLD